MLVAPRVGEYVSLNGHGRYDFDSHRGYIGDSGEWVLEPQSSKVPIVTTGVVRVVHHVVTPEVGDPRLGNNDDFHNVVVTLGDIVTESDDDAIDAHYARLHQMRIGNPRPSVTGTLTLLEDACDDQ
jgi:hypothetical protein